MSSLVGWPGQGNPADKNIDVQVFTSSGTWVKPANALWSHVVLSSGGTGGSGGRKGLGRSAYLDGNGLSVSGGYATAPDSAALSITGDIDIQIKAQLADWTPSASQVLVNKWTTTTNQSYWLGVQTNGRLLLQWSSTGANTLSASSTASPTIANGETLWVRATMDVDNGASQRVVKFYTSSDGSTWTQLGTTVTTAGATSIFDSTAVLEMGAQGSGVNNALTGYLFRVTILDGYDGAGSTVFDANFETATIGASSFTESSTNAATVTITSAAQPRTGGGGGSAGGVSWAEFDAAALPNNVTVVVGAGGTGGAAGTINNWAGGGGAAGGTTTFGSFLGAAADTLTPSAGTFGTMVTQNGGRGVVTAGAGGINSGFGTRGGQAGAGILSGGGGAGGCLTGGVDYLPGNTGPSYTIFGGYSNFAGLVGAGGVGGVGSTTAGADTNGTDGILGGGGGGGGYGTNFVVDAGAGGRGGSGCVIVTTYLSKTTDPINIQTFTANGTWYKPTDPRLTTARIYAVAGGGGGGSGRCDAAGTARFGGGGGGAGGVSFIELPLSMLNNQYAVTVGTGGTGGSGVSTVATNGNAGGNGGLTSFGSLLRAVGGFGGAGGTSAAGGAGQGGVGTYGVALDGGAGSNGAGTAAAIGAGWTSAGGGGSGITTGNTTTSGSVSNPANAYIGAISATAAATAAAAVLNANGMFGGLGGGGGASNNSPTRNGGNASRGSGGGGGAASVTGTTSGSGGDGGNGYLVVVCV